MNPELSRRESSGRSLGVSNHGTGPGRRHRSQGAHPAWRQRPRDERMGRTRSRIQTAYLLFASCAAVDILGLSSTAEFAVDPCSFVMYSSATRFGMSLDG